LTFFLIARAHLLFALACVNSKPNARRFLVDLFHAQRGFQVSKWDTQSKFSFESHHLNKLGNHLSQNDFWSAILIKESFFCFFPAFNRQTKNSLSTLLLLFDKNWFTLSHVEITKRVISLF